MAYKLTKLRIFDISLIIRKLLVDKQAKNGIYILLLIYNLNYDLEIILTGIPLIPAKPGTPVIPWKYIKI